jgi:hypothetical protein
MVLVRNSVYMVAATPGKVKTKQDATGVGVKRAFAWDSTADVVVQVLVGSPAHGSESPACLPRFQSFANTGRIEARLVLFPDPVRSSLLLLEVRFYLGTLPQVVTDHRIDVCQLDGSILLRQFLSGCSFQESGHEGIQCDTCLPDSHDAVAIRV